jgi:hypothetical protein
MGGVERKKISIDQHRSMGSDIEKINAQKLSSEVQMFKGSKV